MKRKKININSKLLQELNHDKRLDIIEISINKELKKCQELVDKEKKGYLLNSEDFNKRGDLYRLSFNVAPEARKQDIEYLFNWINPKKGEKAIDLSSGTGMFSIPLAKATKSILYAIDPSTVQLENLNRNKNNLNIVTITGSLSEKSVIFKMHKDIGKIDIITSYGGIHHILDKEENGIIVNKQHETFKNAGKMLKKGGRFVAGDVGGKTDLSRHFEYSVKKHCITGHTEKWLTKERFEKELLIDTGLKLVRIENINIKWFFNSERELALFMKGLHAYTLSNEKILKDLKKHLGYKKIFNKIELNWPMLFFHLEKE